MLRMKLRRHRVKPFRASTVFTKINPALMLTGFEDRELCAAVAQAQLDALRHEWSHVSCLGWRFTAHAVPTQHGTLMDLYCEDMSGHVVWSKSNRLEFVA